MRIGVEKLRSRGQTGRQIYYLAAQYWPDLDKKGLLDKDLKGFFNFVRKIPYVEDIEGEEMVSRPLFILDKKLFPALDCKKKAILIASYLEAHGYQVANSRKSGEKLYRAVAVSEQPDKSIHHVFIQVFFNGLWRNVDPTYDYYELFEPKPYVTAAQELLP